MIDEADMTGRLSRAELAEKLKVAPNTIYRWEKRGISPVKPKRIIRTKELVYADEDVDIYLKWMDVTEDAGDSRRV